VKHRKNRQIVLNIEKIQKRVEAWKRDRAKNGSIITEKNSSLLIFSVNALKQG